MSLNTNPQQSVRARKRPCPYCGVIPAPGHGCHGEPKAVAIRVAAFRAAGVRRVYGPTPRRISCRCPVKMSL
jgi:hypothetical protein